MSEPFDRAARDVLLYGVARVPVASMIMHIPDRLVALAPTELRSCRSRRFDGDGFGVDLSAFGPDDRARLARIYAVVDAVGRAAAVESPEALGDRLLAIDEAALTRDAQAIGSDTPAAVTGETRVRQLLHDVRGGGLQVLLGAAELLRYDPTAVELVPNGAAAARDHAKIMRAGFPALDPARYAADEAARVHSIDGFVATWDGMTVRRGERVVTVGVECEYRGSITARCLETAAIDRVMYNYVNNAVRFAADGRVTVWIFRTGPRVVRWVVHNAMTADDRAWLDRATGARCSAAAPPTAATGSG